MKIFAGSLPFSLEDDDLKSYFEKFGEVSSAKVISDKFSGRSKGFGFVEMVNDQEGSLAIQALHESIQFGNTISVEQTRQRESRLR